MALPFIAQLVIGVGMLIGGYLLMPKPKQPKPPSLDDFKAPTVDAGRPIPKLFGSKTIRDPNAIWHGDKSIRERPAETDKK
jgi:hypothetical protein